MPIHLIKKLKIGFAIITMYVYDLNLIGTPKEFTRTTKYLEKEFEMKDLRKKKYFVSPYRSNISLLEFWFINRHILRKFENAFIWIKHNL